METEVTCVLTEKDRLKYEDRKKLARAYADKLFRFKVIDEEMRDEIYEWPTEIRVSYNPQQGKVEFRSSDCHGTFPCSDETFSQINRLGKLWRKNFTSVIWPLFKSKNTPAIVDHIECDGTYNHGRHIITLTV